MKAGARADGQIRLPVEIAFYRTRFGTGPPAVAEAPRHGLRLVVVVPCHDEPGVREPLNALGACSLPEDCAAEVLVVVNGTSEDSAAVKRRDRALAWSLAVPTELANGLRVHTLAALDLPPRRAGVGAARKLGMDEALYRLSRAGAADGVIASFDADCSCDSDYLRALHRAFANDAGLAAAAVHFEHALDEVADPAGRLAIARYELGLRCYVAGLRRADYPNAFHTVGSAMAVRASDYAAVGGMNRRRAGEDFHFLHKVARNRRVGTVCDTRVLPSARPSHRVPFGTGKALRQILSDDGGHRVYDPRCYEEVGLFVRGLLRIGTPGQRPEHSRIETEARGLLGFCRPSLAAYLDGAGFLAAARECAANTGAVSTLRDRLLGWMDGLRVLQSIHALTRSDFPTVDVELAAARLLGVAPGRLSLEEALARMRALDLEAARQRPPAMTPEMEYQSSPAE